MTKVPIKLHTANALRWLGSLYRNPADAIKEHVSNAIDEHVKARGAGREVPVCKVSFTLAKDKIVIDYPYGMSRDEFEGALQRVADSAKRTLEVRQIGQLGIGMFSFLQMGRKCTFFSKKERGAETTKVTLKEGSDDAEFEIPKRREKLDSPGIQIVISGLLFDPTRARGPLSPKRLQTLFSEKFTPYLRDGSLEIEIHHKGKTHSVEPMEIDLPQIGEAYANWFVAGDPDRKISLELYFDATGRAKVGIRHMGVVIVEDVGQLSAYGLEETVFGSGHLKGFIDADFLSPLPARSGFEEDDNWMALLVELDKLAPIIEAEVELLRDEEAEKKLGEIQRKALDLAREILNSDEFRDLELLEGLGSKKPEALFPPHGFDFVPSAVRVEVGKTGRLRLKAAVPSVVPEGSVARIHLSTSSSVELVTESLVLRSADADERGIVTAPVLFRGQSVTTDPVTLTAATDGLVAEARIRVGEASGTAREPRGPGKEDEGPRINYVEKAFEGGPTKHSRYVSRVIEINDLNEDYRREVRKGSDDSQLAYAALMIGKETIAFNDKTGMVDEYLEKLLSYYFSLRDRLGNGRRRRRAG